MRVVKCWPQHLPARRILERRRNTPVAAHLARIDRKGGPKTRQRGAIGADEKHRLNQIAARLLDRKRRQIGIVKRTFCHHPVYSQCHLLTDLRDTQFRHRHITAPFLGQPAMSVLDRAFAAFDSHIHQTLPPAAVTTALRGKAASLSPQVKKKSSPSGNRARLARKTATSGRFSRALPLIPGP